MAEPLAVIPELAEDAGAGKTKTDAPESTRKFLEEKVSFRYRREDEEPAGRNVSSHRPVSFPTRSRVAYTSGPCVCVSCETSRWRRREMGTYLGSERQLGCWNDWMFLVSGACLKNGGTLMVTVLTL